MIDGLIESQERIDVVEGPEGVAMSKVVDILRTPLLKHSFVRFGPSSIEGKELSLSLFRPNQKDADPTVDRLKGIFKVGLVSAGFAEKIGIKVSRNWGDQQNQTGVSLSSSFDPLATALGFGMFAGIGRDRKVQIARDNIFIILIDPNLKVESEKGGHSERRKYRIAQRFFQGIVIVDEKVDEPIDFTRASVEETVDEVIRVMRDVYGGKNNLYAPIYGMSGALLWPRKMSYQELQEYLEEKN